ncbi:hypothetical protein EAE99_006348 [Botrytis elliptica]|nr:hypothetical protein EAE99_006348 [Botrytis elliptica]
MLQVWLQQQEITDVFNLRVNQSAKENISPTNQRANVQAPSPISEKLGGFRRHWLDLSLFVFSSLASSWAGGRGPISSVRAWSFSKDFHILATAVPCSLTAANFGPAHVPQDYFGGRSHMRKQHPPFKMPTFS